MHEPLLVATRRLTRAAHLEPLAPLPQAASLALSLFGPKKVETGGPSAAQYKFASKWKKVGLAQRASELLKDLEVLKSHAPPQRAGRVAMSSTMWGGGAWRRGESGVVR